MAAFFQEVRERDGLVLQTASVTIIAQDPSVPGEDGILTTQVRIPAEHVEPGPRGARFFVVDYDPETRQLLPAALIDPQAEDAFADAPDDVLTSDPGFRAQNTYAIAARTLSAFEAALGRRLQWSFGGHQLYLVPRAIPEANAFYAPEDGAIYFGWVPGANGGTQTALSHDIVAHETTHAVLDGLRPRLAEPGLPDQPAFHEALGDIVALLSVFSLQAVVERLLGPADKAGRIRSRRVEPAALRKSALFGLAEDLGRDNDRGSGLRRSIELKPGDDWRGDRAYDEPHRRGEVVVAAVMRTLLRMWRERLTALTSEQGLDRARVAEEGARSAEHLLHMMIRGVDYMPPVELEFEDVVDAVLKADEVVAPDDEHGYRAALSDAFAEFGIERPAAQLIDIATAADVPVYERMNYAVLRSDRDEVFRFIWENAHVFGINRSWRTRVESVRQSVRVGPDGLIVPEVVAEYHQSLELTAAELRDRGGIELPEWLDPGTELQIWGGGVLIFDQFGRARWHMTKPLDDWPRQKRRLDYLVGHGLIDTQGRVGFTLSTPRGQRFAALHVGDERAGEVW